MHYSLEKLSLDKLSLEKLSLDKLSVDKLSVERISGSRRALALALTSQVTIKDELPFDDGDGCC